MGRSLVHVSLRDAAGGAASVFDFTMRQPDSCHSPLSSAAYVLGAGRPLSNKPEGSTRAEPSVHITVSGPCVSFSRAYNNCSRTVLNAGGVPSESCHCARAPLVGPTA